MKNKLYLIGAILTLSQIVYPITGETYSDVLYYKNTGIFEDKNLIVKEGETLVNQGTRAVDYNGTSVSGTGLMLGNGIISGVDNEAGTLSGNSGIIRGRFMLTEGNNTVGTFGNGVNGVFGGDNSGLVEGSVSIVGIGGISSANSGNGVRGSLGGKNSGVIQGSLNLNGRGTTSSGSGNGVDGSLSAMNDGVILGKGVISSEGNISGTTNANGVNGSLAGENKGVISGFANFEGEAVYGNTLNNGSGVNGSINNMNSGLVSGVALINVTDTTTIPSTFANGNGINGTITGDNLGTISGYSNVTGHWGNGIITDTSETNFGLIKGSTNAVLGSSTTVKNIGVLGGRNQLIVTTNQGIQVVLAKGADGNIIYDANGNPNIASVIVGAGGAKDIVETLFKVNDVTPTEADKTKTIINGSRDGKQQMEDTLTSSGLNETIDTFYNISNLGVDTTNLIINGVGMNTGALVVDTTDATLTNSIVNGYNTALYVNGGNIFTANNVIFNGGGLGKVNDNGTPDLSDDFVEFSPVIRGSEEINNINLKGTSIVNGATDLGAGDDTLSIANTVQINGNISGGAHALGDTLNLGTVGTNKENSLNILYNISEFETVNIKGETTLYETTKVTGATNINLESGNLNVRVNPLITADSDDDGDGITEITGHSLIDNTGSINASGTGKLVFELNGLGRTNIIDMAGNKINPILDTDPDDTTINADNDRLITNSLVLDAILLEDGDVLIGLITDLNEVIKPANPDGDLEDGGSSGGTTDPGGGGTTDPIGPTDPVGPIDEGLNDIYKSIVSAEEVGKLAPSTELETNIPSISREESLEQLLVLFEQIYSNTPFNYTLKSNRDSLKLFGDNLDYLTIKPIEGQWIGNGRAIYGRLETTNVSNSYFTGTTNTTNIFVNNGANTFKTTSTTYGGIGTLEYGLTDDTSVGLVVGGSRQNINFTGDSKVKANLLYLGTYIDTIQSNFKFKAGLGYQYSSNDADAYYSNNKQGFSNHEKYNVNSLHAYVEGRYLDKDNDGSIKIEPKAKLSYYYVSQNEITPEARGEYQLLFNYDKGSAGTFDIEVGVDLIKEKMLEEGKLNHILSLVGIYTMGDTEEGLRGYSVGDNKKGSYYSTQGAKIPEISAKVSYSVEYEKNNGFIGTAGIGYEFAKDENSNLTASMGIGYKF